MHFEFINEKWVKPAIIVNGEEGFPLDYDIIYVKNGSKIKGFNPESVALVVGLENMPTPTIKPASKKRQQLDMGGRSDPFTFPFMGKQFECVASSEALWHTLEIEEEAEEFKSFIMSYLA
jgi:hypothetical protein